MSKSDKVPISRSPYSCGVDKIIPQINIQWYRAYRGLQRRDHYAVNISNRGIWPCLECQKKSRHLKNQRHLITFLIWNHLSKQRGGSRDSDWPSNLARFAQQWNPDSNPGPLTQLICQSGSLTAYVQLGTLCFHCDTAGPCKAEMTF